MEAMGTKRKFWYRDRSSQDGTKWLFKYPRPDTGEHWAEKIAAEIARMLDIPRARVELATCRGQRGSATKSFRREEEKLIHGNQILRDIVAGYGPLRTYRDSSPLQLVRYGFGSYRESFLPALRKIESLDRNAVRDTVHRVPGEWMSCSERRFAIEMMIYSHAQLQEL